MSDREMLELASVGDYIEADVEHPYPRTLRVHLTTPASCALANSLLMDKASGWRKIAAAAIGAKGE